MTSADVLYLSDTDVVSCGLTADEVTGAIEDAFRTNTAAAKLALPVSPLVSFTAKGGVLIDDGYSAVKWYGYVGNNADRGLPDFSPVIVLSSTDTGLPLAIIDGRWISAVRTASITAAVATILANPASRTVGFVACGTQAVAHLEALRGRFDLERIVAYSRNFATAERFTRRARKLGLNAEPVADPKLAVEGHDIVVTSVPPHSEPTRFLDARWTSQGSFVSMVDLGFAWNEATTGFFDAVVTDRFEAGTRRPGDVLNYAGDFAADLPELLRAPSAWAHDGTSRRALVFAGSGIADAAASLAVYRRALDRGLGRRIMR
jgi:ornithine cyclodeaminase/alanine dehydrogenase-like protein (mu-crystallin family)